MEGKKKGIKAMSDWLERGGGGVGRGLNIFIKGFSRGQQFDRQVYFKMGPLAKMGKAVT